MKKSKIICIILILIIFMSACINQTTAKLESISIESENRKIAKTSSSQASAEATVWSAETIEQVEEVTQMQITVETQYIEQEVNDMSNIQIQIGDRTFFAELYNNDTTKKLVERLPMTISMNDLNTNEKYYYFSEGLPSAAERISQIQAGDLMLFGSDCLVLFYESFSSSYSYTRIAHIEDVTGLLEAVGSGSVNVTFSLK